MDDARFDQITTLLARAGSRRSALGLVAAALAGASVAQVAAAKRRGGQRRLAAAGGRRPCPDGRRRCNGRCVSLATNRNHCGRCGNACATNQSCVKRICTLTCLPNCVGKTCGGDGCGGSCGGCTDGRTCTDGACQCAGPPCGGGCCDAGQSCFGDVCWPDAEELRCLNQINALRQADGQPALTLQTQLGRAAELHSRDQATNWFSSHTGSDGSSPDVRIARAGYQYSWWGENIYTHTSDGTAATAVAWWRQSTGHYANMVSPNFTEIGIGRARASNGAWYWTTTFGRPS